VWKNDEKWQPAPFTLHLEVQVKIWQKSPKPRPNGQTEAWKLKIGYFIVGLPILYALRML